MFLGSVVAGAFTTVAALVLLATAPATDDLLGTGHPGWVRLTGLALAVFAVDVALASRITDLARFRVATLAIAVADASWVVASVLAITLGGFSAEGNLAVLAVAAVVGILAAAETLAWRATRQD